MSILTYCQDAWTKGATGAGVIVSMIVGILAIFEGPRHFAMSYVGVHNQVLDVKNGKAFAASSDGRGLYMYDSKDILSILALHLPLFLVCSCLSDLLEKCPMVQLRNPVNQFRCHCTSALMLFFCLLLDAYVMSKEGYWTELSLWWNGLPQGHMPFFVKSYFLVQLTMLCYWLETVCFSGQNFATIRDEVIYGVANLVFCVVCYMMNFGPLMMVTLFFRLYLELSVSVAQTLSFMDMSGKLGHFVQFILHAHQWMTIPEVVSYGILGLSTIIFGHLALYEQACVVTLFGALIASSLLRWKNGRKYELDGLQTGTGQGGTSGQPTASGSSTQGSGDPSTSRGKNPRSKSKSRK